jgi:dTMP kinase
VIVDPKSFRLKHLPAFIVLDGVNGAGKSTLQAKLQALFAEHGKEVHTTREPGATEIGKSIRELVLGSKNSPPSPEAELLLFGADRAEHVSKVIRPKLAAGISVLSDRYYYSTVAFQGYGRGMNLETIAKINGIAIQGLLPSLLVLLDLDPTIGLKRKSGATEHDRFEHEALAFQQRMREGFIETARAVTEPCLVIDATAGADAVFNQVKLVLADALSENVTSDAK